MIWLAFACAIGSGAAFAYAIHCWIGDDRLNELINDRLSA